MSTRSHLEDGGFWFSAVQGGMYIKGRGVLNLPPEQCWAPGVADHCFIAREVPGVQISRGSSDASGTSLQSSSSVPCSDALPEHGRNISITCTSGIFFFPLSVRGQV